MRQPKGTVYRYRSFVSYSRADRASAKMLQTRLERYILPTALRSIKPGVRYDNQGATNAEVSGTVSGSPSFEANFSVDGGASQNTPLQTEPSGTFGFALGLQETNNVDQKVNLPPPPKCTDKEHCN